jgi:protoheme ferro-lyase
MKTGVLLTNLGTPDAPTKAALKRYLKRPCYTPSQLHLK